MRKSWRRRVAACGSLGVLHVVPQSADTHLYSLIRPAVQAPYESVSSGVRRKNAS